jgi:hypothetical protein
MALVMLWSVSFEKLCMRYKYEQFLLLWGFRGNEAKDCAAAQMLLICGMRILHVSVGTTGGKFDYDYETDDDQWTTVTTCVFSKGRLTTLLTSTDMLSHFSSQE